jgi:putative endonuclease
MWFVYILKSLIKNWFYIGSTNRLSERLNEHNSGKVKSTKIYRPLIIIYKEKFKTEKEARQHEQKLKKCRIEKEKIIKDYYSGIV